MQQSSPAQSCALVTGASSGIGREFAFVAAQAGHNVVLVARNKNELHQVADEIIARFGVRATVIAADLSARGAAHKLYRQVTKDWAVTHLINNAGFGDYASVADAEMNTLRAMIALNVDASTVLAKLAAQDMMNRSNGAILNVASTAGFFAGPNMAVYYATKNYVLAFSEALHTELAPHSVKVSALCPGPTQTRFSKAARINGRGLFRNESTLRSAERVARYGWKQLQRNKAIAVPGIINKLSVQAPRFLPRWMMTRLIKRIQPNASS